jgi:hypothetical protein
MENYYAEGDEEVNTNYQNYTNDEEIEETQYINEKTIETPLRKFEKEREEKLKNKKEESFLKKNEIEEKAKNYREKILTDRENSIKEVQEKNL